MSSPGAGLSKEELMQLINALIDNHFIKDFLIKESLLYTLEDYQQHQHQQSKEEKLKPPTAVGTRTAIFETASTDSF